MIADVCAALLQNLIVESPYCLHFLQTDYAELENYDIEHRREIGKYLKARKGSVRERPLGLMSLGLGLGVLLVCNCFAWSILKFHQKRRMQQQMRRQVNTQISNYLALSAANQRSTSAVNDRNNNQESEQRPSDVN